MPDINRWLDQGLNALILGHLGGAETALRVVTNSDDPTDPPSDWPPEWRARFFDLLGGCRLKRGDAVAAADAYEQALTVEESQSRPGAVGNSWAYLGIALARMHRFSDAEACFARGMRFMQEAGLLPTYRSAVATEFGLVLLDERHFAAAADAFGEATTLAIEAEESPRVVGHLFHLLGTALQPVVLFQRLMTALAPWLDPLGAPGWLGAMGEHTRFSKRSEDLRQELQQAFQMAVILKREANLPPEKLRPSELALENLPKFDDSIDAISAVVRNAMRDLARAQTDAETGIETRVIQSLKGRAWEAAGDYLGERGADTASIRAWQQAALHLRNGDGPHDIARIRDKLNAHGETFSDDIPAAEPEPETNTTTPATAAEADAEMAASEAEAMSFARPPVLPETDAMTHSLASESVAESVAGTADGEGVENAEAVETAELAVFEAAPVSDARALELRTTWNYAADGGGEFCVLDGEWVHIHGWYEPIPLHEIERTPDFVALRNPANGHRYRLFADRAESAAAASESASESAEWTVLYRGRWVNPEMPPKPDGGA